MVQNKSSFAPENIKKVLGDCSSNTSISGEFIIGPIKNGDNKYSISMWKFDENKLKFCGKTIKYENIGEWKIRLKISDWAEFKEIYKVVNSFTINMANKTIIVEWDDNKFPTPVYLIANKAGQIFQMEILTSYI